MPFLPIATAQHDTSIPIVQADAFPATPSLVNHQQRDHHFAYSLWRRTLLNQDERAWYVVYADYQRQVRFWIKRQLRFVVDETTMQTLVDDAFVKMAGTFRRHPAKFADYPNVAALLGLLRLCAQRVVQDYVATLQHRVPVIALDAIHEPAVAPAPFHTDLGDILAGLLHDEQEWQVVTRLLLEEEKPRQLYAARGDLFASVDEINTIRERVKGRLQRNATFHHQLQALARE